MSFSSVLCLGGCVADRIGKTSAPTARLYTSNIGELSSGFGGAARNVAENLALLGVPAQLVTRVGADDDGTRALRGLALSGVDVTRATVDPDLRTASYTAIFAGDGSLVIGLSDMAILTKITPEDAIAALEEAGPDAIVFADANLSEATLAAIAARRPALLAAGPVSEQKALRLLLLLGVIDLLFLNRFEAAAMTGLAADDPPALVEALRRLGARAGVLTADRTGAIVWQGPREEALAPFPANVVNVNGAGDALAGATLARLYRGDDLVTAARIGMAAAAMTVASAITVCPTLDMPALLQRHKEALRP